MSFIPFTLQDFQDMKKVLKGSMPTSMDRNINALRAELGRYPEYDLDFFRKRIVRRPGMRGKDGLVFGPPRSANKHWYLYVVGGDQDQVQLNIGMWPDYLRVGLGFQIGRQVAPKMPAFSLLQTFLGHRPPLPFRDALYRVIESHGFRVEGFAGNTPDEVLQHLETYVVPPDKDPVFVFLGKLWSPTEASRKTAEDFRNVFQQLMPFYEELLLAGGRYEFLI